MVSRLLLLVPIALLSFRSASAQSSRHRARAETRQVTRCSTHAAAFHIRLLRSPPDRFCPVAIT